MTTPKMKSIRYSIRRIARLELEITATFPATTSDGQPVVSVHLPTWRPGRYELGNFAQYTYAMQEDLGHSWETMQKLELHSWFRVSLELAEMEGIDPLSQAHLQEAFTVRYRFRTHKMDAGSSWADDDVLYINPVNCLVYHPDLADLPCEVELVDVPKDWQLASQLPHDLRKTLRAENMQQLMDSPFIAAPEITSSSYQSGDVKFHIHSWGAIHFDYNKFTEEHKAFSDCQIAAFKGFPVDAYHFIYLFPPFPARHGVEHEASTVIAMGPAERMKEPAFYEETLAIGSHELVHTWNVKSLRPLEWAPYDFTMESPSRLGYVAEGVTTYLGDLFLFEAGIIDLDGWMKRFGAYVQKHIWNPGRLQTSLADSSFDTWLDGYAKPGAGLPPVPHRVANIYVEGAILAFLCDVNLNKSSGSSLVDIMRELWQFAQAIEAEGRHAGLTEEAYWGCIEARAGDDLLDIQADLCDDLPMDSWEYLVEAFELQNIKASLTRNDNPVHAAGALTRSREGGPAEVVSVWPDSPAWNAGLVTGALISDASHDQDSGITRLQFSHAGRAFEEKLHYVDGSGLPASFAEGYFPTTKLEKLG